jgi:hypothetical protein
MDKASRFSKVRVAARLTRMALIPLLVLLGVGKFVFVDLGVRHVGMVVISDGRIEVSIGADFLASRHAGGSLVHRISTRFNAYRYTGEFEGFFRTGAWVDREYGLLRIGVAWYVVAVSVLLLYACELIVRRRSRVLRQLCERCGYDRAGLRGERCPECGADSAGEPTDRT